MAILFLLSTVFLTALSPLPGAPACTSHTDACMPPGTQATDVVSSQPEKPEGPAVTITVAQKLKTLRARCRKGKLVDAKGTEIRFYQLIGCWGNPPDDYQQQLERQAKELAQLRKRYRVIEMTCDSSGEDRFRATPPPVSP